MKMKAWLIAGALAMSGCATTTTADKPAEQRATALRFEPTLSRRFATDKTPIGLCKKGNKCRIDLKIVTEGGKCEPRLVDASDELVMIKGEKDKHVQVVWVMTDAAYLFLKDDGIKFKNGGGDFDAGGPINAGHEYQWNNKMVRERLIYNYTIQVTAPDGRKCIYDPGLINDWSTDP
jgi:hypothetical protein